MANRYLINQIDTLQNRKVFFDANVLIYLFWPSGQFNWERNYSSAFAILLQQNNELFVDFLVLSEIINRAHRIEYEKYLQNNNFTRQQYPYKRFRDSMDGQNALSDIYLIVKDNILTTFSVVGKSFDKDEIQKFLVIEPLDFIDKAIQKTCIENNFILCTNDRDYRNSNIDILTSNPAILNN